MKVYYLKLKVAPNIANERYKDIDDVFVNCWILEESPNIAYRKAIFYVKKYDWDIQSIENYPVEVKRTDFVNKELGLANYDKANKEGMAFTYIGWSRNTKTSLEPVELISSFKFDLEGYLRQIKKNQKKGRCLHFEAGKRCNEFIKAHSIQKNGLLTQIQEDGKVYQPSSDISTLKKNNNKISYKKKGVKVVSTFLGFCKKHDNEIFKPIDTSILIPTEQQVFLYAYRSLCRELFFKENALNTIRSQLEKGINQKVVKELFLDMKLGTSFGLKNLKTQKIKYDDSLKKNQFEKIRYVLFVSNQKPNVVFSSLIFPDYDFRGKQLQNLTDISSDIELITFCSAPLESGWGFLFSWHESSSKISSEYMSSLATAVYEKKYVEDFLFRLAINCENHAIAPLWWESKSKKVKNKIEEYISSRVNLFTEIPHNYLMRGLEGISDWKIDNVLCNY